MGNAYPGGYISFKLPQKSNDDKSEDDSSYKAPADGEKCFDPKGVILYAGNPNDKNFVCNKDTDIKNVVDIDTQTLLTAFFPKFGLQGCIQPKDQSLSPMKIECKANEIKFTKYEKSNTNCDGYGIET